MSTRPSTASSGSTDSTGAARTARLADVLLRLLKEGVPQGAEVAEFMFATHGDGSAEAMAGTLQNRDDPDSATLAGLLLSPSPELLAGLEPELEAARLAPGEEQELRVLVASETDRAAAVLPDGTRLEFALEPGEAELFVSRLRASASPPRELTASLDAWPDRAEATAVKVLLRHSRLEWSPARTVFLLSLAGTLEQGSLARTDIVAWTLSWLSCLPPDEPPQERLGAKQQELSTLLRRSIDFHEALLKTSYEVMMAQGARVSLPQPEAIRRELAMLDAVCLAVTGRPGWALAGMTEIDLGSLDDGEAVIDALGGL